MREQETNPTNAVASALPPSVMALPMDTEAAACLIEGCDAAVVARGWCLRHYTRWRRHGHPCGNGQLTPEQSLRVRFWNKVHKGTQEDACWLWIGGKDSNGYGVLSGEDGHSERAHRVSWQLHFGSLVPGVSIKQSCGNRACVRPSHLQQRCPKPPLPHQSKQRGERHYRAKLTEAQVRTLRTRYAADDIQMKTLAREYGVSYTTMKAILSGKTWRSCL